MLITLYVYKAFLIFIYFSFSEFYDFTSETKRKIVGYYDNRFTPNVAV